MFRPILWRHLPLLSFQFFPDATATSDEHKGSSTPSRTGLLVSPADTCHANITLIVTPVETEHNTLQQHHKLQQHFFLPPSLAVKEMLLASLQPVTLW